MRGVDRRGARRPASGSKSCGRLGGVAIRRLDRLAIAHEMHEAAHRVGLGRIVRDAGGLEGRATRSPLSPTQTASTGLGGNVPARLLGAPSPRPSAPRRSRRRARSARSSPARRRCRDPPAGLRAPRHSALASASPTMSTGLAFDQIGGSAASSAFIVSGERAASVPPRSISRSTASTPTPPPLVRIARRLPENGCSRPSVSAAANNSSRSSTRSRPARRNAAS